MPARISAAGFGSRSSDFALFVEGTPENEQFKQTDVAVLRSYHRRAQWRQQQRDEDENLEELQSEVEKPFCCDHMIELEGTCQRCGSRLALHIQPAVGPQALDSRLQDVHGPRGAHEPVPLV